MSKASKARTRESADILIVNAEELVTLTGSSQTPRVGKQMRELGTIQDGALAIRQGRIAAVGKTRDVTKAFRGEDVLSAKGKTVLPGFVDAHTHLVFAGSREEEFEMRVEGASYTELLNGGDGILKTVRETRRTRVEKLVELGLEKLDTMLAHGTTTVEAKSGYGLTTEDEVKILEATRRLNQLHCMNVVPTLLGAHVVPSEFRNNVEEYVNLVMQETIPRVTQLGLAEFCDVFCERGIFNVEQAKKILATGKNHGLKPKIHADHISTLGGAEIAADISAASADSLNFCTTQGIKALATKGVVAVLLPAASFSLMVGRHADARSMIDYGVPVALGSDFNAGCWVQNMQLVVSLACYIMRMTPAEAVTAATINAAHAVCRAGEVGSLEVGKRADVSILNVPNHRFLGYSLGVNLVDKVIADGRLVVDREKQDEPVFLSGTE
ncbi:MAG: imidazolonepropionase [Candidatus Bathyarchaeia archaeon]